MMFKGFKFGMILQFAVGPVCLFLLQTSVVHGLGPAMKGVIGVTLVDAMYITAAILGLGALLRARPRLQNSIRLFGGIVIILFGLSTLLGIFGISFMPSLSLASGEPDKILTHTMLMTLSNPMTILFWTGVFSARAAEDNMKQTDMIPFGLGAVLSTFTFIGTVCVIGSRISFLVVDSMALKFLNGAVGLILMRFGWKTLGLISPMKAHGKPSKIR